MHRRPNINCCVLRRIYSIQRILRKSLYENSRNTSLQPVSSKLLPSESWASFAQLPE